MIEDQEKCEGPSVLVLNPGSTSTKIGIFAKPGRTRWTETLDHPSEERDRCGRILDQLDWREREILRCIERQGTGSTGSRRDGASNRQMD